MCLNSVGELTQKCDRENREWWQHQIKSIYGWNPDLVVQCLLCISCLNAKATNCPTIWSQKLQCAVFQHKNDETKNSTGMQFKAQYQKRHVSCFGTSFQGRVFSWHGNRYLSCIVLDDSDRLAGWNLHQNLIWLTGNDNC